jgi:adenine phosphoribosyltransferase
VSSNADPLRETAQYRETVQETIRRLAVGIPDYPEPGVVFRDLTPVFADGAAFRRLVHALVEPFEGQFDAVAGIEAWGFLLAAAAAYATGTGVVTVRKKGKLPRPVLAEDYALEYGTGTLELHADELPPGSRVLVLDDILANGGTLAAASRLFERAEVRLAGFGAVMELTSLRGRDALDGSIVRTLLQV